MYILPRILHRTSSCRFCYSCSVLLLLMMVFSVVAADVACNAVVDVVLLLS